MAVAVIMPKLEMSQETATVIEWIVQEGEHVAKGEPLLTVETDKVTVDIESPAAGVLAGIRVEPGQVVPVTETIAYVLQPGDVGRVSIPAEELPEDVREDAQRRGARRVPPRDVVATPVAQRMAADRGLDLSTIAGTGPGGRINKADVEAALEGTRREGAIMRAQDARAPLREARLPARRLRSRIGATLGKVRATPAARRIARERGVDLATVMGSGPRGRVQAADVLAEAPAARPYEEELVLEPEVEVVPLQGMRRTIATRMQQSYQTAPHITLTVEVDMSAAQELRRDLNARALKAQAAESMGVAPDRAPDGGRISVTAILVKVCAWALQRHRWVNASLQGVEIHLHKSSNIGVAVALEEGLIVPVIHQAERLGLAEIARRLSDLSARARQGRLTPEEVHGGTFTISNLGMYGIDHFTAILNPPESAILAVGRIAKRSLVVECEGRDEAVIRPVMNMTLSVDHRVLDGAVAARFLRDVVDALEHPSLLLW